MSILMYTMYIVNDETFEGENNHGFCGFSINRESCPYYFQFAKAISVLILAKVQKFSLHYE